MNKRHTIFSINPTTSTEYISIEEATNVIRLHILIKAKNVIDKKGYSVPDLIQEVLVKLCFSEYKPNKSAPKTFILTVCMSVLGNIAKRLAANHRDKEVLFIDHTQEEMASNTLPTYSPEDVLIACELWNENPVT